ncbi:ATP-binding protein [Ruminococcus sp.]|uniref:sensor histidine kinase n=1 Tax=Ruminococcus sp. TaxID=41978 RepID=UPI0025CB89FA|nr:ATP-binding protein [Ruminococcus sp.]MBO4523902.1 histidine kinase [Ruminococcus sp.]
MTKKIFLSIISICIMTLLAAIFLITAVLSSRSAEIASAEVKTNARLIASAVEQCGGNYLDKTDFGGNIRVTWIDSSGNVVYDTDEDPDSLENHSDREEILQAFESGEGSSSRYSSTIMQKTINHAIRLRDGSVIRVSGGHSSLTASLLNILNPMLAILIAVVLFSVLAASMVSRTIVRPINNIDLDHPKAKKNYKELTPLLEKLSTQNIKVSRQMDELQSSREQFSLMTESMEEGLIIADPKLIVLTCNSSALRLLGAGSFNQGQSIYALNNSDVFRRCLLNALGGRRSECILRTGDGQREVIASPANSIDMVCGIVVFIMDITEKQELETMRREFTSNVSHELKTPLTTIYGIADMLANGMVQSGDVAEFGGNIRSESERLINLINDIVSLSKLDEDTAPRENESIELYALAEEVLDRLKLNSEEKGVVTSLSGEKVSVMGSRTILSEVLYNLCDNGIKYNVSGGSLSVKVSHVPQRVIITVSDTGIGIPKQYLGRVFERFYRVDKSRSSRIKGTGLGLSIVKHGVLYHNGTVRVDSEEGKGTVFTVELPIEKKQHNEEQGVF